ncbi:Tripartite tricarboxylate transporter family receptor [Pigmentiphaga humi]|uniref:Tripartite tricarboxylate transporter family receptor n=1 Tax=Pigmentiphaga humi TaxID=2478468 RepID=A0A3P4B586_9BURK|nr:tripartite tricarboxylate transporter substrate binding protein [Pigmentiphaga humi]VCU71453.1 Tripartite tricarboxylate transporter family receptor [Pigmentiphaga humi]
MRSSLKVLLAATVLASTSAAHAADYPTRPVRLVVPHGAGGTADVVSRIFADYLGRELGQSVIVENKPGASTMLGAELVANAPPDGYTLLMASVTTLAINPSLYKNISYDPQRDFKPVSMVASLPFYLIASPQLKIKSVQELIALARAKPGQLNYYSPGEGTSPHLVGALFASMVGLDVVHVPYKTTAAAEVDLNAGRVHYGFTGSAMPAIKSGRATGIAVTGAQRTRVFPDIPTLAEQGVAIDAAVWNGVVVPAGTPQPIVDRLAAALGKIARMPEVIEKVGSYSGVSVGNTPAEFSELIKTESAIWAKVIRETGAKGE